MYRKEILKQAERCVCGERDQQYGGPERSFAVIAELWSTYLSAVMPGSIVLADVDVAAMMALLKLARIATASGAHPDSWGRSGGLCRLRRRAGCGGCRMTAESKLEYIRRHTALEANLAQLAEEASELAQAALKLRRALGFGTPTTTTELVARQALLNETGDLAFCLKLVCDGKFDREFINCRMDYNAERSLRRCGDAPR